MPSCVSPIGPSTCQSRRSRYYPEHHGFDFNVGGGQWGQPASYFSPYKIDKIKDGPVGEYLTDRLAQKADGFITANRDRPFFFYFPGQSSW